MELMNIDDPIKAAETLIQSDESQISPVTGAIANLLGWAGMPGADKVAGFLDRRRAENRDLLLGVLRDELQRLKQCLDRISEEHRRFFQTDFAELVADGLRKAENLRDGERIVRIAKIQTGRRLHHGRRRNIGPIRDLYWSPGLAPPALFLETGYFRYM